jgi:hypothetical protein
VIDRVLSDMRAELHTAFPARVLAYDADAQTVDVRPALLREVPNDEPSEPWGFEQLPDLLNVPFMALRTSKYGVLLPVEPGDWVLVLCAEQSTMLWRSRGDAPAHPGLNDPHGLNGCVAIPGWFPDAEKLESISTTDLVIGKLDGSASVRIQADGTIVLGTVDGAHPIARADKVEAELKAIKATLASLTGGAGAPATFTKPYESTPDVGAESARVK